MEKKELLARYRNIIPYISSSVVLIALGIFSPMPIVLAGLISVAFFVGTKFMLRHSSGLQELPDDLVKAIEDGEELTIAIRRLSDQIKKPQKDKVDSIVLTAESILKNLRKKPEDARIIREFLSNYLLKAKTIIEKYVELRKENVQNSELEKTLKNVEDSLDHIDSLFKKQQVKLLKDGVMNLDVEIEVLKTLNEME